MRPLVGMAAFFKGSDGITGDVHIGVTVSEEVSSHRADFVPAKSCAEEMGWLSRSFRGK